MIVIDLGDGRVKLLVQAPNYILDTRTQRTYYEVICKKTQVKYFKEIEVNE